MPPKRSDDYSSEEELDDISSEEEIEDPDYQEEHHAESEVKKNKNKADKDDVDDKADKADDDVDDKADKADDDEDVKSDDDDDAEEIEFNDLEGDEDAVGDEIIPPSNEIVKRYKVVDPELRRTSDRMSLLEVSNILGARARHIDNKARPNTDTTNYTSSLEIAYTELLQRKIPFSIIRKIGNGAVEIWRCKEMIIPKLPPIEYFQVAQAHR